MMTTSKCPDLYSAVSLTETPHGALEQSETQSESVSPRRQEPKQTKLAKRPAAKRGPSLVRLRAGRRGSGQSGVKGERRAVQRGQVDHHGSGRLAEARNRHQQHLLSPGVCHAGRKGTVISYKGREGTVISYKCREGTIISYKGREGRTSFHTKVGKGERIISLF